MKKPQKEDFGYVFGIGWTDPNGKRKYGNAICEWEARPRKTGGRQRTRPIHPSWNDVLQNFDSTNPLRSQGAFCRWADLNRGTFSAMQCKPLLMHVENWILEWEYIVKEKEVDNE